MTQHLPTLAALVLAAAAWAWGGGAGREAVVREMLERSRLLEDVQFKVPLPLWRRYVRETAAGAPARVPAPVPMIAEEGLYQLTVGADQAARLAVRLRLRVFDPHGFASAAVLSTRRAWEDVKVDGQPADLLMLDGWLRFVAVEPGLHEITASAPLKAGTDYGGSFELRIPRTVRTQVRVESPGAWGIAADARAERLRGTQAAGTHGQIALTPRDRLAVSWKPPTVLTDRPPRYQLSGAVAWNLDAAVQQVSARLDVAIVGGRSDRMVVSLPASAERVSITGPDVREARVNGGSATVHLRGKIAEQTRLHVHYEMPLARTGLQRLGGIEVRDGHWAGGTLVVTNTAGGSEVLPEHLVGLRELALSEVPPEAAAILAGPPVVACAITSRQWSAAVDVVDLGEFALRESIADLAHYQLAFRGDGSVLCKATWEMRNRTRQFLRLDLPRGSTVLLARVNEKTRPLSPVPGASDAWLLPLIRSEASVKGLVTFPVEVVLTCRVDGLARRGEARLPLPRIDLPIAYAWCEAYVPEGMRVGRWAGPLRRVEQYSSETAKVSLGYGRGLAADGYKGMERPTTTPTAPPPPDKEPAARPTPKPKPKAAKEERLGSPVLRWLSLGRKRKPRAAPKPTTEGKPVEKPPAKPDKERPTPTGQPEESIPGFTVQPGEARARLSRNYYRAGVDFYEQQDFDKAAENLRRVLSDYPKSPEADNARRLLSNIDLAQGKLRLRSRAEKAAGAQVKRQQALASQAGYEQQQEFMVKGLKAAREGRLAQAKAQLQAAGSLSGELLQTGGDRREQSARLQVIQEKLAEVRHKEATQVTSLFKKVEELEKAGDYERALQTAQQLRQHGAAQKRVQDKLQELTVASARQKAEQQQVRQLRERRDELRRETKELHRAIALYDGKTVTKGGRDLIVEDVPIIGADDRGPDDQDTTRSLAELKKDVERLRGKQRDYRKRLDSLAAARPGKPVAKTAPTKTTLRRAWPEFRPPTQPVVRPPRTEGKKPAADWWARFTGRQPPRERTVDEAVAETLRGRAHHAITHLDLPPAPRGTGVDAAGTQRYYEAVQHYFDAIDRSYAPTHRKWHEAKQRLDEATKRLRDQRPDVYSGLIRGEVVQPRQAIRGKVTAADPRLGLVVLNAGQRQGARKGHSFVVFRGSQYVGKVVVDEVFPDVAAAHYDRPNMRTNVQVGDEVTTRLLTEADTPEGPGARVQPPRASRPKPALKMYDVSDLTIDTRGLRGRQQALGEDLFGGEDDDKDEPLTGEKLVEFIKRTITPGTWEAEEGEWRGKRKGDKKGPTYTIQYRNGRIVVGGTVAGQKQVGDFIEQFRQARGPQVQLGANIARQQAQGQVGVRDLGVVTVGGGAGGGLAVGGKERDPRVPSGELRRFVERNYRWQLERAAEAQSSPQAAVPATPGQVWGDLSGKLGFNLGQKVQVSSINVSIPAQAANQLGVRFVAGNNGVVYGVVDEAQFRTLMELDERRSGSGRVVAANPNWQDTIVGTDALLANGWTANVRFGADVGNTIDINANPINLEHDKYILIDNGGYLTAVRAGEMQHWSVRAPRQEFAAVPQDIDVPRVGQMVKFEKTLVEPDDELVLRASYSWKGEGR